MPLDGGARFAWSGDRLMIHHSTPRGAPCIAVIPNARGHFKGGAPVTLDLPILCTACGARGRLTDGRWVILKAEATE
jgi:hypothetical protein